MFKRQAIVWTLAKSTKLSFPKILPTHNNLENQCKQDMIKKSLFFFVSNILQIPLKNGPMV